MPDARNAASQPAAAASAPGASRWRLLVWLPALVSMLFTAVALLPELRPLPNLNDGAFHFLLIQEAAAALARGDNVFDFWSPVLELGFPQFLYYQHLPHLAIVLLDRLLPGQIDLIWAFNGVRYALLVGFPLTVGWSLTQLGFARPGAALAAAVAPLISGHFNYGFEYDSYLWRGHGMYTQLWAMHLSLIALALLARHLDSGRHRLGAIAALSALILSHLVYAYMTAISAVFFLLWGLRRANARTRLLRFATVWGSAAVVTAYLWLPFLWGKVYLSASPYLQRWKYDSFGAMVVLGRLVSGTLFDDGRPPVITALVGVGLAAGVAAAWHLRSRQPLLAPAFFALWLALYFGRATWGAVADLLPMHEGLIMHRFIGGVQIAALMLVAAGGAWLWKLAARWQPWRPALFAGMALVVMLPALVERYDFYRLNDVYMTRSAAALVADPDAAAIVGRLAAAPPGRVFAGLRTDWGKTLKFGDLAFTDLLTFARVPAVSPPYQSLSLNADLIWHFDYRSENDYRIFDVRHVVAPAGEPMPGFLDLQERRGRYALYEARASSYFTIGRSDVAFAGRQAELLPAARTWLHGRAAADRSFPEIRLQGQRATATNRDVPTFPLADANRVLVSAASQPAPAGRVIDEASGPQSHRATVVLDQPAAVVLKVTYHPNWRATVDGVETPTMMVMPSFVGVALLPGRHEVSLAYRGDPRRTWLLVLGAAVMALEVSLAAYRRWPPRTRHSQRRDAA